MEKRKSFKNTYIIISAIIGTLVMYYIVIFITVSVMFLVYVLNGGGRTYETKDVLDYGNFTGVYDEKLLQKRITTFFPQCIDKNFENVKYSYKAIKVDAISCEAYLEFEIKDEDEFQNYILNSVGKENVETFNYDSSFCEKKIFDYVNLDTERDNLEHALIGRILYNDDSNIVIYSFIMVYDGGGTTIEAYDSFFSRFNINSSEYYQMRDPKI